MDSIFAHLVFIEATGHRYPSSPALAERISVACSSLSGGLYRYARSIGAPFYVTDLGVRLIPDPKIFYKEHCKIFSVPQISPKLIEERIVQEDLANLASVIDSIILFFGDYEAVAAGIKTRMKSVCKSNDYSLLIHSGVVLAALGDANCMPLFEAASEAAVNSSEAYGAHHRAAAFLLKRERDDVASAKQMRTARSYLKDSDAEVNAALLDNLNALRLLRGGGDAFSALEESSRHLMAYISRSDIAADDYSRACRYKSQVSINMTQLLLLDGLQSQAMDVMLENVNFCRMNSFDYLGEALAEASYTAYIVGDLPMAEKLAREAFWRNYPIGAIRAIRGSREILAASLFKTGRTDAAESVASLVETDPLGLKGVHD